MLDRIFGYGRSSKSNEPEVKVDCFECRMVGGSGLTALGGYIIYYAFKKRNGPLSGRLTMFASGLLGSVVMTMGLLRLAGIHDLETPALQTTRPKANKSDGEMLKD